MNLSTLQETVKDRKPGVLQSLGSQRVGHDLVTEQHLITTSIIIEHIFVKRERNNILARNIFLLEILVRIKG